VTQPFNTPLFPKGDRLDRGGVVEDRDLGEGIRIRAILAGRWRKGWYRSRGWRAKDVGERAHKATTGDWKRVRTKPLGTIVVKSHRMA